MEQANGQEFEYLRSENKESGSASMCWLPLINPIGAPLGSKCVDCRALAPCSYRADYERECYLKYRREAERRRRCKPGVREKENEAKRIRRSHTAQLVAPALFPDVHSEKIEIVP